MKLDYLRTLEAVVTSGSFAAAADAVNLTASAVGLQIKQLEAYFGRQLFDRSGRRVSPTLLALEVIRIAHNTLCDLDSLRRPWNQQVSGSIRVGAIEHSQTALLPDTIRSLRVTAPKLEIQFVRGVSSLLMSEVKAARLDAAIVVQPKIGGSKRLHWNPLMVQRYALVAPSSAPPISAIDLLRAYDWIRLDRSSTGGKIAAAYVQSKVPGKRSSLDLLGIDAIVAMIAKGLGVSVLPALRDEVKQAYGVREVSLGRAAPKRQISLVYRAVDSDNRSLQALLRALISAAQMRQTPSDFPGSRSE